MHLPYVNKFMSEFETWHFLYAGHVDVRMISNTGGEKNHMIKNHSI